MRLFALSGFERIESGDAFERPEDFDLQAYLNRAFGVFQEDEQDVVWRFRPNAAPQARRFLFHPTQQMEDAPDGSLIVRFRACGMLEMCWHLFRWGDQVEVLGPDALQEMYAEMSAQITRKSLK